MPFFVKTMVLEQARVGVSLMIALVINALEEVRA